MRTALTLPLLLIEACSLRVEHTPVWFASNLTTKDDVWRDGSSSITARDGQTLWEMWDGRLAYMDYDEGESLLERLPAVKRWAVCATGQLSRLEIPSKVANLLRELEGPGVSVDLFLVLEMRANYFVNGETNLGSKACSRDSFTIEDLKKELYPWYRAGLFVQHEDFSGQLHMKNWPQYGKDKKWLNRTSRLANHFSQWTHIAACEGLIEENEDPAQPYTDILRVRENSIVTKPFRGFGTERDAIVVKKTESWHGINDKAMYTPRAFLSPAFTNALQLAQQINAGHNLALIKAKTIRNPEQLLAKALKDIPLIRVGPEAFVTVDGRCYGEDRSFCLVDSWKDHHPTGDLWSPPCRARH